MPINLFVIFQQFIQPLNRIGSFLTGNLQAIDNYLSAPETRVEETGPFLLRQA